MEVNWQEAAGGCGLNTKRKVYAAYVKGVALFAFEVASSQPGYEHFSCIVTGHMTCGGGSLEEVQRKGVSRALEADPRDADRKLSKAQFDARIADASRLRYIPVAEYVIGCCHYGHTAPYKTVVVQADSLNAAMAEGQKLLSPSIVEHICHVETRPNPEHVATLVAAGDIKSLS